LKVLGFAAYSGNGKTTLIEKLIPLLCAHGLKVSVIKHAHHGIDVERPGKDSHRHRQAGAAQVLVSSAAQWALAHEHGEQSEPELPGLLRRLLPCDLVLVEGFKREPIPKIEVHRAAAGTALLFPDDPCIVAVASDVPVATGLPVFHLDDHAAIAEFVVTHLELA